jgi:hypothetical protein
MPVSGLQDASFARQQFQSLLTDKASMEAVRVVLKQENPRSNPADISDVDAINRLAELIGTKRFHFHPRSVRKQSHRFTMPGVAKTPAAFPLGDRRNDAPTQVREEDPTTFGSGSDADAQAGALRAAADSGKPFCAVCEKNRQQQEQSAVA